jgi:hypothetical protein
MSDSISNAISKAGILRGQASFQTTMNFPGSHMSVIEHPENPQMYLATMRQIKACTPGTEPKYSNSTILLELDSNFNTVTSERLRESELPKTSFHSAMIGLEDCRLLPGGTYMTAVSRDFDPKRVPMMCFCEISRTESEVVSIRPLVYDASSQEEPTEERNWLVLKYLERQSTLHMLHSYNPLRIISVRSQEGDASVLSIKRIFRLQGCTVDGGACVYIPHKKRYVLVIHVMRDNQYVFSHWILLNELYTYIGVSDPFRFEPIDPAINHPERCMSLLYKDDENILVCCVSVGNNKVNIYGFPFDMIHETIYD